MRVKIRGLIYESVRAAASANNVSADTVYDAVSRRDPDSVGVGRGKYDRCGMPKGGMPPTSVTIGGKKFPSMAALARYIGREPRNVRTALRSGGQLAQGRIVLAIMKREADEEVDQRKDRQNKC
jgi:hypothetical protein